MKVFVYYHRVDLDGQFSAAVCKLKYGKKHNIEMYGYDYGDDDVPLVEGYDIVIMTDISMPVNKLEQLKANNSKFIWIDHHAKTIREVEKSGHVFDGLRDIHNKNSACVLTWKFLFPKKKVPYVLEFVEDVDLWKFDLSSSEGYYNAMDVLYKFNIDRFVGYLDNKAFDQDAEDLWKAGEIIIAMRDNQIERAIKTTTIKHWNGYNTGVINTNLHKSNVGNDLLEGNPQIQVAMIWNVDKGKVKVSLRSRGNIDVAVIASKYGGGGHKPASGFSCDDIGNFFMILEGN